MLVSAILPVTLILIEQEESQRQAADFAVGSILGPVALAGFAIAVWQYMSGSTPVILSLATATWPLMAIVVYLGLRRVVVRQPPPQNAIAETRVGHEP